MLVSVLLPTYNGEKFINRAISGVLNQSYSDMELLVIDDGSTDKTAAIVQGIAQGDPRVRYIKNETNLGIQKSLNRGLREAKGEWIARVDDDDQWVDKKKIEKQIKFLELHRGYVLVGTGLITQDTNGKELYRFFNPRKDKDIRRRILYRNCFSHSTIVFSKEAALKAGGYSESAHALHIEDYDLWLKLGMCGKFANIRDYAVRLTIHKDSISAVHKIVQFKKQIEITKRYSRDYPCAFYNRARSYFRLAAIMYSETNSKVVREQNHRQIQENVITSEKRLTKRLTNKNEPFIEPFTR